MSKRQIKAKRWLRKKLIRRWQESIRLMRSEDILHFPEQVRILGDGTVQYRWGFYANTFSWKRYKSSLRNEAWRNR